MAVLIVSFGSDAELARLLPTLMPQLEALRGRVVISDNTPPSRAAAGDVATAGRWPVLWLRHGMNLGYGAALNAAAEVVPAQWYAVLNPDTELPAGALQKWLAAGQALAAVGALGCVAPALRNRNGRVQKSSYRFLSALTYWENHSLMAGALKSRKKAGGGAGAEKAGQWGGDGLDAVRCDWVMGAAMLLPAEAWHAVGGFDAGRYFLYAEDMDLCRRLAAGERPTWVAAGCSVVHEQGDPPAGQRARRLVLLMQALLVYSRAHLSFAAQVALRFSMAADALARLLVFGALAATGPNRPLQRARVMGAARMLALAVRYWARSQHGAGRFAHSSG